MPHAPLVEMVRFRKTDGRRARMSGTGELRQTITFAAVVGALTRNVQPNGYKTRVVLDTGSGIGLISGKFVESCCLVLCGWDSHSPVMSIVTGDTFSLPQAVIVETQLLNIISRGELGVVRGFLCDILLGMDFPKFSPILLDFENLR